MASLGVSLGMAIFFGLITGYITSRKWFQPPTVKGLFDDRAHWYECEIEHDEQDKLVQEFENNKDALQPLECEEDNHEGNAI